MELTPFETWYVQFHVFCLIHNHWNRRDPISQSRVPDEEAGALRWIRDDQRQVPTAVSPVASESCCYSEYSSCLQWSQAAPTGWLSIPLENKEGPQWPSFLGPSSQPWTGAASARSCSEHGPRAVGCNEVSSETESRHLQAFTAACKNYSMTVASYNKNRACVLNVLGLFFISFCR